MSENAHNITELALLNDPLFHGDESIFPLNNLSLAIILKVQTTFIDYFGLFLRLILT